MEKEPQHQKIQKLNKSYDVEFIFMKILILTTLKMLRSKLYIKNQLLDLSFLRH